MSLGTGALKVGRGPEHFRVRQGGIHDVVWSAWIHQDLQKQQQMIDRVWLTRICEDCINPG